MTVAYTTTGNALTQYYGPSWTVDTSSFTVDSTDVIYTADGGLQTDGYGNKALLPPTIVRAPNSTRASVPAGVKTTIAYY